MEPFNSYFKLLQCLTEFLVNLRGKTDVRQQIWSTFQRSLYKNLPSPTNNSTDANVAINFLMVPIIINHESASLLYIFLNLLKY